MRHDRKDLPIRSAVLASNDAAGPSAFPARSVWLWRVEVDAVVAIVARARLHSERLAAHPAADALELLAFEAVAEFSHSSPSIVNCSGGVCPMSAMPASIPRLPLSLEFQAEIGGDLRGSVDAHVLPPERRWSLWEVHRSDHRISKLAPSEATRRSARWCLA